MISDEKFDVAIFASEIILKAPELFKIHYNYFDEDNDLCIETPYEMYRSKYLSDAVHLHSTFAIAPDVCHENFTNGNIERRYNHIVL